MVTGFARGPADVAAVTRGGRRTKLTVLNEDLLGHKMLGQVEEITWTSPVIKPVINWISARIAGFSDLKRKKCDTDNDREIRR